MRELILKSNFMSNQFSTPSTPTLEQQLGVVASNYERATVEELALSARAQRALNRQDIFRVDQLLQQTAEQLLSFRNMGHGSVEEILTKLSDYIANFPEIVLEQKAIEVAPRQRTLLDEWELFAGSRKLPDTDIGALNLDRQIEMRLASLGVESLEKLLAFHWPELIEILDYEDAETIISAIAVTANESRYRQPDASAVDFSPDEVAQIQGTRWANTPISKLSLSEATRDFLGRAGDTTIFPARLQTLNDLQIALDSPTSALFHSFAAYSEVWELAVRMGLRSGDALAHRQEIIGSFGQRLSLEHLLTIARESCGENQWEVLRLRFGLGAALPSRTLDNLRFHFRVSRERVRQIEGQALKKLRKNMGWKALADDMEWLAKRAGGVISADQMAEFLEEHFDCGAIPPSNVVALIYQINESLKRAQRGDCKSPFGALDASHGPIYGLQERVDQFPLVIETACKLWTVRDEIIESEQWHGQVMEQLEAEGEDMEEEFVMACLRADRRFDPHLFERAQPRLTLEIALVQTLQKHGAPLHFTELTAKLNEFGLWHREADAKNVYSRMGVHPKLFVCVDRGTYGLFSWGLGDQRRTRDTGTPIAELITEFLEARGQPTHSSEIVEYVLERKKSRDYSVLQRLGDDPLFHRFKPGFYGLKKWVF